MDFQFVLSVFDQINPHLKNTHTHTLKFLQKKKISLDTILIGKQKQATKKSRANVIPTLSTSPLSALRLKI